MRKDLWMLAAVGLITVGIWGTMIFSLFFDEADTLSGTGEDNDNSSLAEFYHEQAANEDQADDTVNSRNSPAEDETVEKEADSSSELTEDGLDRDLPITERGILPGDLTDIAPDGKASVEDVLERINEAENE
ncbi:hypothetical protein [Salisediminibacterium halotolerans]|uniref:hypothetical protein n=1 Tax=Salisediminibacterium halotolerans TaxID=517425 RepID=UPI000EB05E29|nr:hypothetical protein [Salisediminibacterium halotolerans]RLJ69374.1 hypothetical protein BCL39_2647 [Actinophytocola xinjiangensis]RPE84000.1 hypothetical protein EDD67_2561 [Salisediminibacterium halotolerans]TWG32449.1 hypothetical protein BCL52_2642 [Salisediminibacterium halotolerans]GEL07333.1 hypothetical protein SHA02_07490 [Salisediminibacterium halotolerans]